MKPVCVIVRDGWGYNEKEEGNAVLAANTPNVDGYKQTYPWNLLECSGEAVGLPEGFQGSSEVGHLNMGAGRIVIQELKRIDDGLKDGSLFGKGRWLQLMENWKSRGSRLHLFGLLQDEGLLGRDDQIGDGDCHTRARRKLEPDVLDAVDDASRHLGPEPPVACCD